MPMNGKMLAAEMLAAIGGKVTKQRRKAFEKLADAIVKHIQLNAVVTGTIVGPAGPATTGMPILGSKATSTGIL
jgi:hypothetical protein